MFQGENALARHYYPRKTFPWHTLPGDLERSLKNLAVAVAGSANPLPGYIFCLIGSALGSTICVEAKESWVEPLIFWHFDIRDPGEGKTAPMWLLADNLKKLQASEYERYEQELTHYEKLSEQERKNERQPAPPRGYYVSNATIEGLYTDLSNHPTGGLIMLLNEISSLLTAQGQYKGGKGSDRESWLELWDGSPVRTVRSGGSGFIKDARVQVVGGTQPGTFSKIFNSEGGIYLSDGTVFRGLYTYEPTGHFEVTDETWKAEERAPWERVYKTALKWAESRNRETLPLRLSPAAWQLFKTWRNECDIAKLKLPLMLRGFIPKSFSYILQIAGALHCLESFSTNSAPSENINDATLRAGIDLMEFYLGQAVDAVRLLSDGETAPPVEMSERTSLLARTFEGLRNQTDNGRLAVGFIQEQFNMPGARRGTDRDIASNGPCFAWIRTDCFRRQAPRQ